MNEADVDAVVLESESEFMLFYLVLSIKITAFKVFADTG